MFAPLGVAASCIGSTCAVCACKGLQCAGRGVVAASARAGYCLVFLFSIFASWLMRDYAKPIMEKIPWLGHETIKRSDAWYGRQAVYRLSLGNFLFFAILAAVLYGVKEKGDKRDKYVHHGNWALKIAVWLVLSVVPFFLPAGMIDAYSWLARFGAGVFLVIQLLILLDFAYTFNDACVDEGSNGWLVALFGISVGAYIVSVGTAAVSLYWFSMKPEPSCPFNVGWILLGLFLCLVFTFLSLHPKVPHGSLFPSALISAYCMYLCFSALSSEPRDYVCNGLGMKLNAASGSTLAIGMALTILSVTYSALRAGSNSSTFKFESSDEEDEEEGTAPLIANASRDGSDESLHVDARQDNDGDPVSYDYSFFHLVFALASMYTSMLMTGWGNNDEKTDLIDIGWASVWVKFLAMVIAALLYMWTLVAPSVLSDRSF